MHVTTFNYCFISSFFTANAKLTEKKLLNSAAPFRKLLNFSQIEMFLRNPGFSDGWLCPSGNIGSATFPQSTALWQLTFTLLWTSTQMTVHCHHVALTPYAALCIMDNNLHKGCWLKHLVIFSCSSLVGRGSFNSRHAVRCTRQTDTLSGKTVNIWFYFCDLR